MYYVVLLVLYLIAGALNLIGTQKGRERFFAFSKPCLMPLLCLYCVARGMPEPDLMLVAALCACWIGDVLLMIKGDVWFAAGGISFFAGHVLFILAFARETTLAGLPLYALIPAAALYAGATGYVMFRAYKEIPLIMRLPMLLYLLCNGAPNLFALARIFLFPGTRSALSFAGAVLFFLSDCALYLLRYDAGSGRKYFIRSPFFVMLTYITGVFLIVVGLVPPVS